LKLFFADNHYGARPGWNLYGAIKAEWDDVVFYEDDVFALADAAALEACDLLILNLLIETDLSVIAEANVKAYLKRGGNVLLLHCGSVVFEQWAWWRRLVGLRWVRSNDPEGVDPSTHPVRTYQVKVVECAHPLSGTLCDMDLPEDEIYIRLQQTCPVTVLMETTIEEGVFPQCCEAVSPWGGRIVSFLPGHASEAVIHPDLVYNVAKIIKYLSPEKGT